VKTSEGATPQNSIFASWRPNDLILSDLQVDMSQSIKRYRTVQVLVITQPATLPVFVANCEFSMTKKYELN
jgi:hypothetical protein